MEEDEYTPEIRDLRRIFFKFQFCRRTSSLKILFSWVNPVTQGFTVNPPLMPNTVHTCHALFLYLNICQFVRLNLFEMDVLLFYFCSQKRNWQSKETPFFVAYFWDDNIHVVNKEQTDPHLKKSKILRYE